MSVCVRFATPLAVVLVTLRMFCPLPALGAPMEPELRAMVEADWQAQEADRGRRPEAPEALEDALGRVEALLTHLERAYPDADLGAHRSRLAAQREQQAAVAAAPDDAQRWEAYRQARLLARDVAFQSPPLQGKPLLYMRRLRFICQMLHEYMAYYYDYGDIAGGGVYVLDRPGYSATSRDLIAGRLPRGNYATPALSYDGQTIYFAYAERADQKPAYGSEDQRFFHLYAMDADGGRLRRLTDGAWDDFDPCPLPDGNLVFISAQRGGYCRCNNPWEPLPVYTLHRMDGEGKSIRTLSFHETNEWHPWVLNDGRLVYTRWDYVDRSAAHFHGLWTTTPEGTQAASLFGNYTMNVNACYQPRSIPGSNKILFVVGAHHANVGGALALLDTSRAALDLESGQDRVDRLEVLTPEVCFPEAPGWPDTYYHSPWPLSEDQYLVSWSRDPLPGMGPGIEADTKTGLYYFDRFGNMELIQRVDGVSCMYPIPLAPRPAPPVTPSQGQDGVEPEDRGEFYVADVRQSLFPLPEDRPIVALRVFQLLPKGEDHVANSPRIGYANAENARMLLGTVPVESDGSAYFRAPARRALAFQAVDSDGRAVQGMRSVAYLQPGERRSCVGCHEPRAATAPVAGRSLALRRPPSDIAPGPDGTAPFSFVRLAQPVLDRHCVGCHDGTSGEGKGPMDLRDDGAGHFSQAYENLRPFARWHEWGDQTITPIVTRPGRMGADVSPLMAVMAEGHNGRVHLAPDEWQRLVIWLDANAPFYGVYEQAELTRQRQGQQVAIPVLQ